MEIPDELRVTDGRRKGPRGVVSLLSRNGDFRFLFLAMVISFAGDWFLFVALAGLLDELTGSAAFITGLYAAMFVPFALFTFVGGPLADRLNRQVLMVVADVLRGILALGFILVDRPGEVWVVFLLAGLISSLQAAFEPAAIAALPNLVDRRDLASANVLAAATWGTMLAVGSALGGLVVTAFGREVAYAADAASFVLSAVLVLQIRRPFSEAREARHAHPTLFQASRETIRYARRDHRVLALLSVKGGFGLGAGAIALLPVLAFDVFDAGEAGAGILFAFRGAGIVIGPFLIRPFLRDNDLRTVFWAIAGAFAVYALSYAAVPVMPFLAVAGIFVFVGHLGGGVQWTLSSYALQVVTPDRIRGRIFAFDQALISVSVAVSATVAGWAANVFGVRAVMLGLAGVGALYTVVWTAATAGVRRAVTPQEVA